MKNYCSLKSYLVPAVADVSTSSFQLSTAASHGSHFEIPNFPNFSANLVKFDGRKIRHFRYLKDTVVSFYLVLLIFVVSAESLAASHEIHFEDIPNFSRNFNGPNISHFRYLKILLFRFV